MKLPTVEEMMDALSSPIVPINRDEEEKEFNSNTEILLDLVKSMARIEDKLGARGNATTEPSTLAAMPLPMSASTMLEY